MIPHNKASLKQFMTLPINFSIVDAVELEWSMWSKCSSDCWRNGEKRPRRNRTLTCNVNGVEKICNQNFEDCADPCEFGRSI